MNMVGRRNRPDRRGMTMLLALLIMAALTAAGIGASTIVVTELRTASATDQGVAAYYLADIGMERAMYNIYVNRVMNTSLGTTCSANTTCDQVKNNKPALTGSTALSSGGTVQLTDSIVGQTSKLMTIRQNQTGEASFFDPDNQFGGSGPRSLYLIAPGAGTGTAARAEVQWVYFLKSNVSTEILPQNATVRLISERNLSSGVKIDLFAGVIATQDSSTVDFIPTQGVTEIPTGITFNQIAGWIVRIKALNGDVSGLTIHGCTTGLNIACPDTTDVNRYTMYSDFILKARGKYRNASFVLQAEVPWKLPSVGVFDYALFSEQSLDKPN